jgi:hypothetical protein
MESRAPAALLFDIGRRGFPYAPDGTLRGAHAVDQEVHLALGIAYGSIASAPEIGHTIGEVRALQGVRTREDVADRVRRALRHPLERGDIELRRVEVTLPPPPGRLIVVVEYTNLRLAKAPLRRVTAR